MAQDGNNLNAHRHSLKHGSFSPHWEGCWDYLGAHRAVHHTASTCNEVKHTSVTYRWHA